MNAVPIPAGAAATNGKYSIVIFYDAKLDVVFVAHTKSKSHLERFAKMRD